MSVSITEPDVSERPGLLYYEFLPLVRRSKDTGQLQFQDLEDVIDRANEWCRQFSSYRIVTLETVQFKFQDRDDASTAGGDDAGASESAPQSCTDVTKSRQYHGDGLRVWLFPSENQGPCEIGFRDLIPRRTGVDGQKVYESIPQLLGRFNAEQERGDNPIPGKIINVESRDVKNKESGSSYEGSPSTGFSGVWTLRIFFYRQEPMRERICVHDVVPRPYDSYTFEDLPAVMKRASIWLQNASPLRLYNVQTLFVKAKLRAPPGTTLSQKFRSLVRYLKVVRLVFSKFPETAPEFRSLVTPRALSHRLFIPQLQDQGRPVKVGDAIQALKEKMSLWSANMAGDVLCAESLTVDYHPGKPLYSINLTIPESVNATYGQDVPKTRVVLYFRVYTNCHVPVSSESRLLTRASRTQVAKPIVMPKQVRPMQQKRSMCRVM
ncbi:uncharacterized protein LOC135398906 [Ornithodoros turicata]|uniref:uncharacterized protein LOC135398906 n=1 Tax=Ornithodoros turicata TaxID=34597 RepID=UPI00313862E9